MSGGTRNKENGLAVSRPKTTELEADGVSVDFDGIHALQDVSFRVAEGEIVGLIGPNGAGKTTLLNVLTGFHAATSGRVILNGEDVSNWSTQKLVGQGVARTFQGARVFGRMSVRENIEVGAIGLGTPVSVARQRAETLIRDHGLGRFADRPAAVLPAGLRRRLGIARALAAEPRLVLMDEPAAGLNEAERSELVGSVGEVRDRTGCGFVIIEHSMPVIMKVCERLHVLDGGHTLIVGTPGEVRSDPQVREAYLGA